MEINEVEKKFEEAVIAVNNYTEPLPADLLLKLYAYYKIAKKNFNRPGSKKPLINAFKANALVQAKNIDELEAKKRYIDLVESYIK